MKATPKGTRRNSVSLVGDGGTGAQSSGGTVLVVDDDDQFRETVALWLAGSGWEVLEAANGAEALELLDDSVDVLVLDRRMPELPGSEVVDRVEGASFDGRIVVVSAYEPDSYLDEDDVAEYITKPIKREQFLAQLRQDR